MKKKIGLLLLLSLIAGTVLAGCGNQENDQVNTESETEVREESENKGETEENTTVEETDNDSSNEEALSMNITIGDMVYEVALDDNETTRDIISHMPLDLSMVRYAGHEYYSELPFTPVFDENRTSEIKAGHVYYWDGWNAFVINYIDSDIAPYQVVHIGEITDAKISEFLTNADETIEIQVSE